MTPYNKDEKRIINLLVQATNIFFKLNHGHPSHIMDFVDGIHKCQNVIMHRILQRDYPKEFPTYQNDIRTKT